MKKNKLCSFSLDLMQGKYLDNSPRFFHEFNLRNELGTVLMTYREAFIDKHAEARTEKELYPVFSEDTVIRMLHDLNNDTEWGDDDASVTRNNIIFTAALAGFEDISWLHTPIFTDSRGQTVAVATIDGKLGVYPEDEIWAKFEG